MLKTLQNLDRRWVFLAMLLAVAIPILTRTVFPEVVSKQAKMVFDSIDDLPDGSNVLLSYDFDPASQGELLPMAQAFTRHCSIKGHKQYYMALWPLGSPMVDLSIDTIESEYPDLVYGEDYMKFDYKAGGEAVIRMITQDMRGMFPLDSKGVSLDDIPMTKNIKNIQDMDLIINVSAGDPGTKQWVQFAATPFGLTTVSGCTGVQAPQMYPYIPEQLAGVLGAIKAAAEYEAAIDEKYPSIAANPKAQEAKRRMGPQLVAHALMIGLIVIGNWIYFRGRKQGGQSTPAPPPPAPTGQRPPVQPPMSAAMGQQPPQGQPHAPDSWWSKFKRWFNIAAETRKTLKTIEDLTKEDDEDTQGEGLNILAETRKTLKTIEDLTKEDDEDTQGEA